MPSEVIPDWISAPRSIGTAPGQVAPGIHHHEGGAGGTPIDHDDLANVTANQHHDQEHDLWGSDHADVDDSDTPDDGDVITWDDGAGKWIASPPAGGGGSGALVLLEQHTASASATLDFTAFVSSDYDEYLIELVNVIPATNGVALYMRMSTDGGSTYDSGANYSWEVDVWTASAEARTGATGDSKLQLTYTTHVSNDSHWGVCGKIRLFSPGSTALYKQIEGNYHFYANDPVRASSSCGGAYESTTAVDALRFLFNSGNIASGTIRVYGVVK